MSYQVTARKWRPSTFSEVVGQDHITRTLKNALKQGRLAHAFLFTGPRGVGKTSTARILARAVNCTNIDLQGNAEPCNSCDTCKALFEDRELDVIEMDAASYTGVDDIRKINENCRLAPASGTKKVYIIDEVHMLSRNAFNAFLKTLEEPPEHVIFVLATTDVHKLPHTILSRVQRFDFKPLTPTDIAKHLLHICEVEKWQVEKEALWLIAQHAEGALRDAEGLLDQVISFAGDCVRTDIAREILGVLPTELFAEATSIFNEHKLTEAYAFLEQMTVRGIDYSIFLRGLQSYWVDLIFQKQNLDIRGKSAEEIENMKAASATLAVDDLFRLIRLASTLENEMKWSQSPRIQFEVSFLRWVAMDRAVTIQDVLASLNRSPGTASSLPEPPVYRPPQPSAPIAPTPTPPVIATPAPQAPAPVKSSSVEPVAPPSEPPVVIPEDELTIETIQELWPKVVATLKKKKPLIASVAESHWKPESLTLKRLSICCPPDNSYAREGLNSALPLLTSILAEITGHTLTLIPATTQTAPADQKKTTPASAPKASVEKKPAPPGDELFSNLIQQFGGVEIDPKNVREP